MKSKKVIISIVICFLILSFLYKRFLDARVIQGIYAAMALENYNEAEKHFRLAYQLNPFDENNRVRLGHALVRNENYQEAREIFKKEFQTPPDHIPVLKSLLKIVVHENDLIRIEEFALKLIKLDPQTTYAYPYLTEIYRQKGDIKKAEEYAILAVTNAKYLPAEPKELRKESMKVYGEILFEAGKYLEAGATAVQILKFDDNDLSCVFELAKVDEYIQEKKAAMDNWKVFIEESVNKVEYDSMRVFAEKRLKILEQGDEFLKPPPSGTRVKWGEIPE